MNEQIIIDMVKPYIKDNSLTYNEFNHIFEMLSLKEQYKVTDILYKNKIELIDDTKSVLEMDTDVNDLNDEFTILYDESLFEDNIVIEKEILDFNKEIKQSNENLCYLIQRGSKQAAQDLCVKNRGLVVKYVEGYRKKYGHRLDEEDLEQVGYLGLIKAAQKFDLSQGTAFSTYAVFWIRQAISREIMDNGHAIRIPVHMIERINKVMTLDYKLIEDNIALKDRIITISSQLDISEDKVKECMIIKNNYLTYASLDTPIGEDEETYLGDFLPAEDLPSVEDIVANNLLREELIRILKTLPEKEEQILKLRFGIDDNKICTLEEIGRMYNVTRERIRQIEMKALRRLKHPSKAKKLKDYL